MRGSFAVFRTEGLGDVTRGRRARSAWDVIPGLTSKGNPARTREDFLDLMAACFGDGRLSLRAFADDLGFSFSTVFRWREGRSAPHPSLWPRIEAWVTGQALARSGQAPA